MRDYLVGVPSVSETALSLGAKLGISRRRCRVVLEQLAREGLVRRRDFEDLEPIFYRYPGRDHARDSPRSAERTAWRPRLAHAADDAGGHGADGDGRGSAA